MKLPRHQHEVQLGWLLLQLYTQDFYRDVVKPKLNPDGIFVTQSGPAGVLSSTEVFTAINKTLQSAFPAVLPYAYHIPSYNDAWVSYCSLCMAFLAMCYCHCIRPMTGAQQLGKPAGCLVCLWSCQSASSHK